MIVDASVAVKWVLEEEFSDEARSLAGKELYAPDLLYIDCANILWKKAAKGDLTLPQAASALKELQTSPVAVIVSGPLLEKALALAGVLRWESGTTTAYTHPTKNEPCRVSACWLRGRPALPRRNLWPSSFSKRSTSAGPRGWPLSVAS